MVGRCNDFARVFSGVAAAEEEDVAAELMVHGGGFLVQGFSPLWVLIF